MKKGLRFIQILSMILGAVGFIAEGVKDRVDEKIMKDDIEEDIMKKVEARIAEKEKAEQDDRK